jgi:hypothetical protein
MSSNAGVQLDQMSKQMPGNKMPGIVFFYGVGLVIEKIYEHCLWIFFCFHLSYT